jgi:hypothetical protein
MKDNSALPILLGFLLLFVVLATMASVVLAFVTIINIYGYGVGMIAAIIFNILVLILALYGIGRIHSYYSRIRRELSAKSNPRRESVKR